MVNLDGIVPKIAFSLKKLFLNIKVFSWTIQIWVFSLTGFPCYSLAIHRFLSLYLKFEQKICFFFKITVGSELTIIVPRRNRRDSEDLWIKGKPDEWNLYFRLTTIAWFNTHKVSKKPLSHASSIFSTDSCILLDNFLLLFERLFQNRSTQVPPNFKLSHCSWRSIYSFGSNFYNCFAFWNFFFFCSIMENTFHRLLSVENQLGRSGYGAYQNADWTQLLQFDLCRA